MLQLGETSNCCLLPLPPFQFHRHRMDMTRSEVQSPISSKRGLEQRSPDSQTCVFSISGISQGK